MTLELIRTEGLETYKELIREAVEEGRRSLRQRIRQQLIPGTYRSPAFIDYQFAGDRSLPAEAAIDGVMHAPVTTTVRSDGTFAVSLDGANGWGYHSFNCTYSGMWGGLWALLAETLLANDKMNDGAFYACELDLPAGSWANPDHPMTSHSDAWYILVPAFVCVARALARAHQARGYVEEVVAGWSDGTYLGGCAPGLPNDSVVSSMEPCCVGGGAGVVRDGIDHASCSWTPTSDMGEVEDLETFEPLLYIGRSIKPNSPGLGRRRGGAGYDCLRMVWEDRFLLQSVSEGAMFSHSGIFGGYPAAAGYRHTVRNTNLPDVFANRLPYPTDDREPTSSDMGRLVIGDETLDKRGTTQLEQFSRNDLFLYTIKGGPGLGDPLERVVEHVQRDIDDGIVSREIAERVNGVVLAESDGQWQIDAAATDARRLELRKQRLERATPAREWIEGERRRRVLAKDVIEPLANMYRSSFQLSSAWSEEYRSFWRLDDDFSY